MTTTFYTSDAHKARFLASLQQLEKVYDGKIDQEYGAALYVLTSSHSTWEKARGYVSHNGIDFEALLKDVDFSDAYSVLIHWAANLFNSHAAHCDPVELMRLDERNFTVASIALQMRRTSLPLDDLQEKEN